MTGSYLPEVATPDGELVRLIDAAALLRAAGLEGRLGDADVAELGAFVDNAEHLKRIADEARGVISDAILDRMDKRGKWTLRVDVEDGPALELKGASPDAGTTKYDTERLKATLEALVGDDIIDQDGARGALEQIPGTIAVTRGDLGVLARGVHPVWNEAAGHGSSNEQISAAIALLQRLDGALPDPNYKQRPAGIKALLKVPGAKDAIEACRVDVAPPQRRVTVKPANAKT